MEKLCNSELCTGCGACASVCPVGCIHMEPDNEGFLQPVVQPEKCVGCNRCQLVCPIIGEYSLPDEQTDAYAAINLDEQVRYGSTSGGIFTLLCEKTLAQNGIVYGAAYDSDFTVRHCAVEKTEDLPKFRGAKYVQSCLGDTYVQVRKQLEKGRCVLFSGTPCQVGGLCSFLGKDYENLILVDLICHGVPSPKVWQHYIGYRSAKDASGLKPARINLRSKETGWPGYSIRFDYPDGQFYSAPNSQDPYLRGFVGNLYLRRSCYNCHFKGSSRQSDFTLGDYWGVWSQLPHYHDEKGTSLVLLHTDKAKRIWQSIEPQVRREQVSCSSALVDNPSALVSEKIKDERQSFFERYLQEDFQELISELLPISISVSKNSIITRIIKKIWRVVKQIGSK